MGTEDNKEKIVETALQLFNTRGCKGVTMDDIATSMHISKRTLYETFANKEELLSECLMRVHDEIESLHHQIFHKVDEPLLVAMYMIRANAIVNHNYHHLIEDSERCYPEIHNDSSKSTPSLSVPISTTASNTSVSTTTCVPTPISRWQKNSSATWCSSDACPMSPTDVNTHATPARYASLTCAVS